MSAGATRRVAKHGAGQKSKTGPLARTSASGSWMVVLGVMVGLSSLAIVWFTLSSFGYNSRNELVSRGIYTFLPYVLPLIAVAAHTFTVPELMVDRAIVAIRIRADSRRFLFHHVGRSFTRGFGTLAIASALIVIGCLVIGYSANVQFSPGADGTGRTPSSEAEHADFVENSGLLAPIVAVSVPLGYAAVVVWTGIWGGLCGVLGASLALIIPRPRLALLVPLAWYFALETALAHLYTPIGFVSIINTMYPMLVGPGYLGARALAGLLYMLPAVVALAWAWRRFDDLPGTQ